MISTLPNVDIYIYIFSNVDILTGVLLVTQRGAGGV